MEAKRSVSGGQESSLSLCTLVFEAGSHYFNYTDWVTNSKDLPVCTSPMLEFKYALSCLTNAQILGIQTHLHVFAQQGLYLLSHLPSYPLVIYISLIQDISRYTADIFFSSVMYLCFCYVLFLAQGRTWCAVFTDFYLQGAPRLQTCAPCWMFLMLMNSIISLYLNFSLLLVFNTDWQHVAQADLTLEIVLP